jgi:hypothetical protein
LKRGTGNEKEERNIKRGTLKRGTLKRGTTKREKRGTVKRGTIKRGTLKRRTLKKVTKNKRTSPQRVTIPEYKVQYRTYLKCFFMKKRVDSEHYILNAIFSPEGRLGHPAAKVKSIPKMSYRKEMTVCVNPKYIQIENCRFI